MTEELAHIDTAQIDALVEIKKEQAGLRDLVEKATALKDKVSAAVHQKVVHDYQERLAALEAKAQPLREAARAEFAKLSTFHGRLKADLSTAELDKEEVEFRHELGELGEEGFERQHQAAEQALAGCQAEFDEADALRKRFVDVLPPEPVPVAPLAAAPVDEAAPEEVAAEHAAPEKAKEPATEPVSRLETVALPIARLIVLQPDGSPGRSYALAAVTGIGRTDDNDIPVDSAEVSRKHAKVAMTGSGYVITDLKSGNGTYVNGKRISEQSLKPGDDVKVGGAHFVFKVD